ncbi:MAG: ribosomal protein S18-alanine N-acetyltransferase [Pseudomonadota bacterium]
MNAVLKSVHALEAQFEAMTPAWLEAVVRVEQNAYDHPWTQGNFSDSLKAGYQAQLLTGGSAPEAEAELLGYFVAMKGVDEVHLLNITVAAAHQRRGWARVMLDALAIWARGQGAQWLWLEVRVSNTRAKAIYERYGFRVVGLRRNYYPAGGNGLPSREDAVVMSFAL